MDQAHGLPMRERFRLALEKFWRAHIVDDDPYDAFENERFEALCATQAAERIAAKSADNSEELPRAA
jgi:hypothetical protein